MYRYFVSYAFKNGDGEWGFGSRELVAEKNPIRNYEDLARLLEAQLSQGRPQIKTVTPLFFQKFE